MNKNHFTLREMTTIDFSISHTCIDSNSPLNTNESHFHEACEIYLNLSGNVLFEVENRIYPISRGSVIITSPYEYHHCIYRSNQPHEHYWITFSADHKESFLDLFFTIHFLFICSSTPAVYSLQLYWAIYSPDHTSPLRLPSSQS